MSRRFVVVLRFSIRRAASASDRRPSPVDDVCEPSSTSILLVIESERGADRFAALDQFLLIDL
jgi:hypothetical protein